MLKALLLDSGSTIKLKYTSDAPHLIYLTDTRGAGYYNCGYGCQWYDYDPGCLPCVPPVLPEITVGISQSNILKTGQVWCWGTAQYGVLGNNNGNVSKCTPVSIQGSNKTFCKIISEYYTNIGIDKNGQIWGWGYNGNGQLGNNNSGTNRCTPVSIQGTKKTFCQIGVGYGHTVGVDNNSQVWGWGYNNFGQLGDNSTTNRCTPISILGVRKTFCKISSGTYHITGIDNNGQVWSWGYNANGQLGNGIAGGGANRCTPVSIQGTKKTFCQIKSNGNFTIGIDKYGQVWGWGYNPKGQLGVNSTIAKCTPVSIQGTKKTFCNISAGQTYTIGIDKNGQVWGWGYNNYGQLGDNSIVSRCTPVSILGAKKTFCKIASGELHTLGVDNNGQVWSWGYNAYGQLGDKTIVSKNTPIRVCNF